MGEDIVPAKIVNEHLNKIENAAQHIRLKIADEAEKLGVTPCQLEIEILKQSFYSPDCDRCHVWWLEFYPEFVKMIEANVPTS